MLLKDEIVARYYFQKGATETAIEEDDAIKKALEVLANKEEYSKVLIPN